MPAKRGGERIEADVIVVGAGVMGLFTALSLKERGLDVLLVDAWGAAHPRATSADESRVIRCGYGGADLYTGWARRGLLAWRRRQREWGEAILFEPGVLWMISGKEAYAEASFESMKRRKIPVERLTRGEAARRFPQMDARGLKGAIFEPEAGTILARRACQLAARSFDRSGGRIEIAEVRPGEETGQRLREAVGTDGRRFRAGSFVFACGPWLPGLFPSLLGKKISVTRKEVFYFGTPAGSEDFTVERFPVWLDLGTIFYGIPSVDGRGFKVAPDLPGRRTDPSLQDRRPSARLLKLTRDYLARRFPRLKEAPVVESRVCQYESTADDHLIIDRHPRWSNVLLVGGGSGHGFKHGPVIGDLAARALLEPGLARVPAELLLSHHPAGRHF